MKNFDIKRLVILDLTATLFVFAVVCIFWIPFDQSKLLRPIPASAAMISSHGNLGPRIENLATNIFFKSFFDSDGAVFKKLQNNRSVFRILASRLTIIAYIPDFDQFAERGHAKRLASAWSSNPALVTSSWVGGWSPILRWALWIHPPKDIAPLGDYNGHRLWTYKKPVQFSGAANYFSFAINEGVFVGCLSQDRNGIAYLMKNYDGRKNSILNMPDCNAMPSIAGRSQFRSNMKTSVTDQVWIRVDLPHATQNKSFFAACSVDALENDYLSATIRFDPDIPLNDFAGLNRNLAEIGKINACSPSIIALFPSEMVAGGLNEFTRPGGLVSPAWGKAVKPILSPLSGTNNVILLTVFAGNYGGKFGKEPFQVTVPTVLLALSGFRPEQTKSDVLEFLDFINTRHRLGLILNSSLPPAGQCPIYVIESTSGPVLKSMPVEDQPAFSFYNDWFLLASNSAGLRKLLVSFQSQSFPADDGNNNWLKQPAGLQKKTFIRIDPGEGGKALRLALTASIIMLDADNRNPSKQNTILILKAIRSWLEAISSLKNCAAGLDSEDGKTVVRLEIGCRKSGKE